MLLQSDLVETVLTLEQDIPTIAVVDEILIFFRLQMRCLQVYGVQATHDYVVEYCHDAGVLNVWVAIVFTLGVLQPKQRVKDQEEVTIDEWKKNLHSSSAQISVWRGA